MDITEEYIEMCDKALVDVLKTNPELVPIHVISKDNMIYAKTTPLFREDQLQEMSGLTWHDFDLYCWNVIWEDDNRNKLYPWMGRAVPTKQKAGLMAYMDLKHNKRWDGKEWTVFH